MDEELRDAAIIWLEERGENFRDLLAKSDEELISMMQTMGYSYAPIYKDFVDGNGESFWPEETAAHKRHSHRDGGTPAITAHRPIDKESESGRHHSD